MLVLIGVATLGMLLRSRRGTRRRRRGVPRETAVVVAPPVPKPGDQAEAEALPSDASPPPGSPEPVEEVARTPAPIRERPAWEEKTAVDIPVVTSAPVVASAPVAAAAPVVASGPAVAAPVVTSVGSDGTPPSEPPPPDPRRGPRHGRRAGRGRRIGLRLAIAVACLVVIGGLTVGGIKLYSSLHHAAVASADRASTEVWNLTRSGTVVHRVTVDTSDPRSLATGACRIAALEPREPRHPRQERGVDLSGDRTRCPATRSGRSLSGAAGRDPAAAGHALGRLRLERELHGVGGEDRGLLHAARRHRLVSGRRIPASWLPCATMRPRASQT